jgi:hypothetical protein
MQPLFEAVSNAIFAIEDAQKVSPEREGIIDIYVADLRHPDKIDIEVVDNGIGLDDARYRAFCQLDTNFKKERGGKGVGRLFWLDSFANVRVESKYLGRGQIHDRAFAFLLSNDEQLSEDSRRLHLSRVKARALSWRSKVYVKQTTASNSRQAMNCSNDISALIS